MKKTILVKAAGRLVQECGRKWGRDLGERAVSRACQTARRRGLTDRDIDAETLWRELRQMHEQGRLNKDELLQAFKTLQKSWKDRKKNPR
jgi:uncharacterized protein YqgQ